MKKLGKLQRAEFNDEGVSVTSDLSNFTLKESLRDLTFWHVWFMLSLSLSFCFFIKVAYKSYGSTIYSNDKFLTLAGNYGFITAAISKFVCAAIGQKVGFKKVYIGILCLEIFLAFTINRVSGNPYLYSLYICGANFCEGGHFSIFPPLAS